MKRSCSSLLSVAIPDPPPRAGGPGGATMQLLRAPPGRHRVLQLSIAAQVCSRTITLAVLPQTAAGATRPAPQSGTRKSGEWQNLLPWFYDFSGSCGSWSFAHTSTAVTVTSAGRSHMCHTPKQLKFMLCTGPAAPCAWRHARQGSRARPGRWCRDSAWNTRLVPRDET